MKRIALLLALVAICGVFSTTGPVRADDIPEVTVRPERPRIYLRPEAWDGPSVESIRQRMDTPEYRQRLGRLGRTTPGKALLWMLADDEEAGKAAVEEFKRMRIGGRTPTPWGDASQRYAMLFDWLRDHPDMDEESRQAAISEMEQWGDRSIAYLRRPATPFYCRYSSVVSGITHIALALAGESPRAAEFLGVAKDMLATQYCTFRQAEDGAAGGGSYAYRWQFTHLANMVAAWRSATDFDAGEWIAQHQGDWLRRQLLFQIWMTYPNGWFVKDGNIWPGSHIDNRQFRMPVDTVTSIYREGFGRTYAQQMFERHGVNDYHPLFTWHFFVFNDPSIEPSPMNDLDRAELFSSKLHRMVAWRSSWEPDATIIHFRAGETVDHHATYDVGKFLVYRHAPLAIKDGGYHDGKRSNHHRYYQSPWSANTVVFTGDDHNGMQPGIDFHGTLSWDQWKAQRERRIERPPTGVLTATEVNERFARAAGDMTGSCPPDTQWTRELVFLDYKYLLVLDRVTPGPDIAHRWLLHTVNKPEIDGPVAVADNGPGRLFSRTLLPRNANLELVGGQGREFDYNGTNRPPQAWTDDPDQNARRFPPHFQMGQWRLDVTPSDDPPAGEPGQELIYLHVLYPTEVTTEQMPECSVRVVDGRIIVTVGDLEHEFPAP